MGVVRPGPTPIVGIDFGTTNSSVALAQNGQARLVQFAAPSLRSVDAGRTSASSRSLLYLQRRLQAAGKPVAVWTGAAAIDQYLATDSWDDAVQGRLIQSLKSYLSSRDLTGTEIFGRQYRFEELVARMLRDLRLRASEFFGFEVTRALAGRPVVFVGADSEAENAFALERLRHSFLQAGFTEVEFAMEPVAAAYAYQTDAARGGTVLIGDFGGGTTDFSLLRMGPPGQAPTVLGTTGVGLAGDAFDARLVRRLISPALGSESKARSLGKDLPALPAWVYANLERWHTLSFLRTQPVRELLRAAERTAAEPEKIASLKAVIEDDLGYRLHGAVQQLKVELSRNEEAEFALEAGALRLRIPVTRAAFEGWIAPELARIENSLEDLLARAKVAAEAVDCVFLTGGTSLVPAVRRVFTRRFGEERTRGGEAFTSVAYGLALMAERS